MAASRKGGGATRLRDLTPGDWFQLCHSDGTVRLPTKFRVGQRKNDWRIWTYAEDDIVRCSMYEAEHVARCGPPSGLTFGDRYRAENGGRSFEDIHGPYEKGGQ